MLLCSELQELFCLYSGILYAKQRYFIELKGRLSKQLTNKSNKTVITRLTHNCAHLRLDNRKNKTKLSQNQVSRHFRSFREEEKFG